MKISQAGIDLIKSFEGLKLEAYLCSAGVPTIGYGSTFYPNFKPVKMGDKLKDIKQAEELLKATLIQFESNVLAWIHTVVHPDYWGKSLSFANQVISWLFSETACNVIATLIPENNIHAEKLAIRSGFKKSGEIKTSFLKNNIYLDQHIYSVVKGDLCRQLLQS